MGDAILCTPALRAIRERFPEDKIHFLGNKVVREILSPCRFCDVWIEQQGGNPFATAKLLGNYKFKYGILFKNSFASALTIFLAGIPSRIGYAREGRGIFLTEKLYPPKKNIVTFKPVSVIDYYLAVASWLGCDTIQRNLELSIEEKNIEKLKEKLPEIFQSAGPLIIMVPGGAFGPSKCWPSVRFAETADWLIENYKAKIIVSVSPDFEEKNIAKEICDSSKNTLINLARSPLTLGELKAMFSLADLVITNDTGPRHIAIALHRKIITLFGPNNPAWTESGYEGEIKIIGKSDCVPCDKPRCKKEKHYCMEFITVESVCQAAKKMLDDNQKSQPL